MSLWQFLRLGLLHVERRRLSYTHAPENHQFHVLEWVQKEVVSYLELARMFSVWAILYQHGHIQTQVSDFKLCSNGVAFVQESRRCQFMAIYAKFENRQLHHDVHNECPR